MSDGVSLLTARQSSHCSASARALLWRAGVPKFYARRLFRRIDWAEDSYRNGYITHERLVMERAQFVLSAFALVSEEDIDRVVRAITEWQNNYPQWLRDVERTRAFVREDKEWAQRHVEMGETRRQKQLLHQGRATLREIRSHLRVAPRSPLMEFTPARTSQTS